MSLFGDGPLGEGLLGDPPVASVIAASPTRPRALQFDPQARDHVKDANGRYVDIDPIDAGVVQSIMFAAKLPGAPKVGQTLFDAEQGDQLQKDVENRVRLAVAWLVNRGDIQIVAIRVEPQPNGFLVELDYINLRLAALGVQTARATLGA